MGKDVGVTELPTDPHILPIILLSIVCIIGILSVSLLLNICQQHQHKHNILIKQFRNNGHCSKTVCSVQQSQSPCPIEILSTP